ncbi:M35 family metallo-endopeptidase [Ideonella sp. DXS29W]|uniref:M35 family metallo-endopeptidase n=1 Tax=Ideonella lacteola TaxID=2984193 RepID=A0ABU9BR59_9BURK
MTPAFKWTVPALAALVCAAASAGPLDRLDVRLSAASPVLQGDVSVAVDVTITNVSGHAVKVLKRHLPDEALHSPLFKITKEDGSAARYVGPLAKWGTPTEADYVRLPAGATHTYRVDLSERYALGNGRHEVRFVGRQGSGHEEATYADSSALTLWMSGRSERAAAPAFASEGTAANISFTGGCTASEESTLTSAVDAAIEYSTASKGYLNGTASGTQRYVEWFGKFTQKRWDKVEKHFNKIDAAFKTKPLTLDCSCTSSAYAYVYPDQPYKIYLCNAFWSAPMKGTDSKGGTLIHEMSHFTVVAGTDDNAYGQSACRQLADNNPKAATENADSHEYFAENNPQLP